MKKLLLLLPTLLLFAQVNSQPLPDSVIARYNSAQSAEEKGRLLFNYLDKVLSNNDSNFLSKSIEIQSYFTKLKDETGSDITGIFIANEINNNGDYSTGLNMALLILSNVEKRNDNYAMAKTLQVIARCYDDARNYDQAIEYLKKAIPIAIEMNDKTILSYTYNSLGAIYAKEFMPDSGLFYGQKAVILDTELKDENHLGFSVSTVAENYIANKDYDLAMPFLRRALKYAIVDKSQQYGTAYIYNDFAQAFQGTKQLDSSNYYANLAIPICLNKNYKEQLLRSYEYLYQNYDVTKQQDSINKYFRLAMTTKDSLYSFEKLKNMQTLSFREQLRQKEIESDKIKAEDERKQNIQFSLLALGIVTFILLFFLLSRSMITNTKVIEFFGILALLIVFEFLNLLLHPYLGRLTNHTPVLMLLALVCIASLLIPAHHALEKWATKQLIEKNKKIRLENAKRTIEKLGHEN